ncbi:MAG: protein jag [Oscillospiraceae bacterium]|nr:protein jag [Oscillospiraceae bacterium]
MTKYIEVTGKTREDAINAGLARLGLGRDDVSVEILEQEKRGIFGFGRAEAKVRLTYEVPDEPAPEPPAPAPAPKAQPTKAKSVPIPEQPVPAAPAEAVPGAEEIAPAASQRERVEQYLSGLLSLMGVKAEITITERPNGGLNAELSGSGMGAVIGRRGETLDAIQHLVNYSVNRGSEKRMHISVDAENYRSKREDSLVRLAEKMAAKAVKYRRSMALEPMNSYERHVIHTALQDYPGVSTASVGVEPNRRVVVNYERQDAGNKPQSREWS